MLIISRQHAKQCICNCHKPIKAHHRSFRSPVILCGCQDLSHLQMTICSLFELHAHLTSLPWLAQVISLVGWPKLVNFFFFFFFSHVHGCIPFDQQKLLRFHPRHVTHHPVHHPWQLPCCCPWDLPTHVILPWGQLQQQELP